MTTRAAVLIAGAVGSWLAFTWNAGPWRGGSASPRLGISQGQRSVCGRPWSEGWVVSPDSVGPIPMAGLTAARLRSICPEVRYTERTNIEDVLRLRVMEGILEFSADPMLNGRIGSVEVRAPGVRTSGGLGAGSSVGELRSAYGALLVCFSEGRGAYAVPRNAPRWGVGFILEPFAAVTRAGRGWIENGDTLRASDRVPDSTRVAAILVWRVSSRRARPAGAP